MHATNEGSLEFAATRRHGACKICTTLDLDNDTEARAEFPNSLGAASATSKRAFRPRLSLPASGTRRDYEFADYELLRGGESPNPAISRAGEPRESRSPRAKNRPASSARLLLPSAFPEQINTACPCNYANCNCALPRRATPRCGRVRVCARVPVFANI
jgi:hypothetical protein